MFRKIELWIVLLIINIGLILIIFYGSLVRHAILAEFPRFPKLANSALFIAEVPSNIKKIFSQNSDITLVDRFPDYMGFHGNTNAQKMYLLLSRYDGNLSRPIVEIIDLTNFQVVHRYDPDIDLFNNGIKNRSEFKKININSPTWRARIFNPEITHNGSLVFHNISPLRKINFCSELEWQNDEDIFHHSINIDPDGNIWVPTHKYPQAMSEKVVGREYPQNNGFLDDSITKVSSEGKIVFQKSISEIFVENNMDYLLFAGKSGFQHDPIHLNDIEYVSFDGKFWKKGDVFLSLRHQSMVLLYRPSSNRIIWQGVGHTYSQHDVDIISENEISIFNNNIKDFYNQSKVDQSNQIIKYNFETNQFSKYLNDSLVINKVATVSEGISEILPNGDLFIEESNSGRTLYFNSDGSLRWFHINRADDGNIYYVSWSRIIFEQSKVELIQELLKVSPKCID